MGAPVKKFNVGAVQAAIWSNEKKDGKQFFSVSFDRRYKDKGGEWKSSNSLATNDLPKAILALQKAFEYVSLREATPAVEEIQ